MAVKLLIVSGSNRAASRTSALADELAVVARDAGAEVRVEKLSDVELPVFSAGDEAQKSLPGVKQLRANADWADAFLLGTPE